MRWWCCCCQFCCYHTATDDRHAHVFLSVSYHSKATNNNNTNNNNNKLIIMYYQRPCAWSVQQLRKKTENFLHTARVGRSFVDLWWDVCNVIYGCVINWLSVGVTGANVIDIEMLTGDIELLTGVGSACFVAWSLNRHLIPECITVSFSVDWHMRNTDTSRHVMSNKVSPVQDRRSTPTYCQLQTHVTHKLGQKWKIRPRQALGIVP